MKVKFNDLDRIHKPIREQINSAINRVIDNNAYILGKEVETFEEHFAQYNSLNGKLNAAGVSTGMDALELILRAMNIGEGDEVISVANTFNATASSIVNAGATPVFVDVDPKYYLMDLNKIKNLIRPGTKAIIPVHLYGQQALMTELQKIAKEFDLKIIEDACQAHGSLQTNCPPATYGDAAAFSFYPGKNLGAFGDAGMAISNDQEIIEKIKKFRNYGQTKKYFHDELGRNNRLDGLQAAVLDIKLKNLNDWNMSRNKSAAKYSEFLKNIEEITIPETMPGNYHVYHLYVIQAENRDRLMKHLEENGIESGIHYPIPIHKQKSFEYLDYKTGDFPVSERLSERIVSLPIFPFMRDDEIEYVAESIRSFYKK